jgi:hypothetical protein
MREGGREKGGGCAMQGWVMVNMGRKAGQLDGRWAWGKGWGRKVNGKVRRWKGENDEWGKDGWDGRVLYLC